MNTDVTLNTYFIATASPLLEEFSKYFTDLAEGKKRLFLICIDVFLNVYITPAAILYLALN